MNLNEKLSYEQLERLNAIDKRANELWEEHKNMFGEMVELTKRLNEFDEAIVRSRVLKR
jgi:predicted nuclease with TOPRIM domain